MKRIPALLLVLILILFIVNPVFSTSGIKGDVNGDGRVSSTDITYIERVILGLSPQTPACDVNGNGVVNMGDVVSLERIILGYDMSKYQFITYQNNIPQQAGNFADYASPGGVLSNSPEITVGRMKFYAPATVSKLKMYISDNTLNHTSYVVLTKVHAGVATDTALSITIPNDGTIGILADTVNTVDFVAGDSAEIHLNYVSGTGQATIYWITCQVVTAKAIIFGGDAYDSGMAPAIADTVYLPIGGNFNADVAQAIVENAQRFKINHATTLSNLRATIYGNTRTGDSTITVRKYTAGAWADTPLIITIPAATTQIAVEDIADSVAFAAGDYIDFKTVLGGVIGAYGLNILNIQLDSDSPYRAAIAGYPTMKPNGTQYFTIEGDGLPSTSQATAQVPLLFDTQFSGLQLNCNSFGSNVVATLQIDGIDTILTVTATGVGVFSDDTNIVAAAAGQKVNLKMVGSNDSQIGLFGVDLTEYTAGGTGAKVRLWRH